MKDPPPRLEELARDARRRAGAHRRLSGEGSGAAIGVPGGRAAGDCSDDPASRVPASAVGRSRRSCSRRWPSPRWPTGNGPRSRRPDPSPSFRSSAPSRRRMAGASPTGSAKASSTRWRSCRISRSSPGAPASASLAIHSTSDGGEDARRADARHGQDRQSQRAAHHQRRTGQRPRRYGDVARVYTPSAANVMRRRVRRSRARSHGGSAAELTPADQRRLDKSRASER